MNKRGQEGEGGGFWPAAILILAIVIIVIVVVTSFLGPSVAEGFVGVPDAVVTVINGIVSVATPIVNGIYFVVAPTGQDTNDNVRMIALAIFFLVTLIGTKALRPFMKGPFLAFFISIIVGVIAARGLTQTILEDAALSASPLAAVSLILGFLPVYAITKNLDKWGWAKQVWSKFVVFVVIGAVYWIFFALIFDSPFLGATYAVGILALGATEMLSPYYRSVRRARRARGIGRTIRRGEHVEETMAEASEAAGQGP